MVGCGHKDFSDEISLKNDSVNHPEAFISVSV